MGVGPDGLNVAAGRVERHHGRFVQDHGAPAIDAGVYRAEIDRHIVVGREHPHGFGTNKFGSLAWPRWNPAKLVSFGRRPAPAPASHRRPGYELLRGITVLACGQGR